MSTTRRRRWPWLLLVAFVVMPLVEIYFIIQVGQAIGPWWTILLLVLDSILGAWLVKREGRRAWAALTGALNAARVPTRELADGALVLIGGTLLLTPGFVTDVLGFLLLLPFTRPFFRRLLTSYAASRVTVATTRRGYPSGPFGPGGPFGPRAGGRGPQDGGPDVVRGEVVED